MSNLAKPDESDKAADGRGVKYASSGAPGDEYQRFQDEIEQQRLQAEIDQNHMNEAVRQALERAYQASHNVTVYQSINSSGKVSYTGITSDLLRRTRDHLREKGITINAIPGLNHLTWKDAHAVEQVLIQTHGLGQNGGTLLNRINSISARRPDYAAQVLRGIELLKRAHYPDF